MQPKEPKKEAVRWYEKRPGLPNDQEMLFFVLLTLTSVATSLSELKEWAVGVQRYQAGFTSVGAAALPVDWTVTPKVKVPKVFKPIFDGFNSTWGKERLESIGKAMQMHDGLGQCDGLGVGELKRYKTQQQGPAERLYMKPESLLSE